jgi:hypothetical protein
MAKTSLSMENHGACAFTALKWQKLLWILSMCCLLLHQFPCLTVKRLDPTYPGYPHTYRMSNLTIQHPTHVTGTTPTAHPKLKNFLIDFEKENWNKIKNNLQS